jgi:sarcosine oxidase
VRRDYTYIVVGLGGIGSAAAYSLARRAGPDVLGLEQFTIGHDRGASQDHSRIIRHSYHTPAYVELSFAAYEAWGELERELGEPLVVRTGGLDLWPPGAAIPQDDYTSSLRACGVTYEELEASEIMRRWPQFVLPDDVTGVFQGDGGIVAAARCNDAHVRLARSHGATLLEHRHVTSIRARGGEVVVSTNDGEFACRKLVVAADAWANEVLAPLDARLPLTVTQEQVTYFAPPELERFSPGRFPVWIWMDDPSFYGFPAYGEAAIKVAQDVGGREVRAHTRTFEVDEAALARVKRWLERYLPSGLGPILYTKTCLYTMPPDRDFVVDSVPGYDDVFVVLGAAHGFKFASLLGRIVADLAVDDHTDADISPFAIDRSILREKHPATSFMV